MDKNEIVIRPFEKGDQAEAKALIQAGLAEHFGWLDPTANPDLNDIGLSFEKGYFAVAESAGQLVGSGGYLHRDRSTVEFVRMSVDRAFRRHGLGKRLLDHLCEKAQKETYTRVILETNAEWTGVIAFYSAYGFQEIHRVNGEWGEEVYFQLMLNNA